MDFNEFVRCMKALKLVPQLLSVRRRLACEHMQTYIRAVGHGRYSTCFLSRCAPGSLTLPLTPSHPRDLPLLMSTYFCRNIAVALLDGWRR